MSSDHKASPTQQPPVGFIAPPSTQSTQFNNITTSFPPTSIADNGDMATPAFLPPPSHAFRSTQHSQLPFPLAMPPLGHHLDREAAMLTGSPFVNNALPPMVRVLIRRLPLNTSEESLRLMVVWSKDLADVELLPVDRSEDAGFRSAILRFRSLNGALEVKNMLDGRSNISNDAEMIVEVLATSPIDSRRNIKDYVTNGSIIMNGGGSAAPPNSRPPPPFSGPFQPMEKISPTSNGAFPVHEFPPAETNGHYQGFFSAQPPIGSHRITGKSLISNDYADDDETSDLLKDPVAYAESSASSQQQQRRATAPHIPINRMANLALNTKNNNNSPPGPSSLPPYIASLSPASAQAQGPGLSFPMPGQGGPHFSRHNFPPVNPADQNPPCNTLYVGNLPIDTSEEELKAMFSKQRGYKRLCFRTKQNGPMCFVEFEDVSFATKALHELYGQPLHNSVKGGIRLSFSKNPLGVRSGQAPNQNSSMPMPNMNGGMNGGGVGGGAGGGAGGGGAGSNGFNRSAGPPPGLAAPPGLGTGRSNFNNTNGNGNRHYNFAAFPGAQNNPWNGHSYHNGVTAGPNDALNANPAFVSRHMMGR